MVLDRTWDKYEQKLTISYIDKNGDRQFYQKYLHHIKTYEYDPDGEFDTWNGKKCNKVYKDTLDYVPTDFDILEYIYELPDEIKNNFYAQNFPKLYTFDIETEVSNEFPDPDLVKQKVTAISLVGPDMSCIVYGLKDMTQEGISLFRERYLDWIDNNEFAKSLLKGDKKPKVLFKHFDNEVDMLIHFFSVLVPKIACLAGWNSYMFDWRYLVNRLKKLLGDASANNIIKKSSPINKVGRLKLSDNSKNTFYLPFPSHSKILDYMEIVKQYDYVLRPYESYSLDWVGSHAVNAHKIKYKGTLQQLWENDPEWYYFYNAIDSLIVLLIHYKLKSLESPCAVSSVTLVPLIDAMGQIALGNANIFYEFYLDNKKVVYNYNEIERRKKEFAGAFCGCVPGKYEFNVCSDFASLYPSQIQTCNFSFENIVKKTEPHNIPGMPPVILRWSEEELDKFRKDKNYFVSVNGNVYKNDKDYAFKRMQRRTKKSRDKFKYVGQKIDSELLTEIDRLIKEKEEK